MQIRWCTARCVNSEFRGLKYRRQYGPGNHTTDTKIKMETGRVIIKHAGFNNNYYYWTGKMGAYTLRVQVSTDLVIIKKWWTKKFRRNNISFINLCTTDTKQHSSSFSQLPKNSVQC